ncbi:hypothetical protein Bbelb_233580 [Branchiostoma belcheri]|nr:hypothetical protein Bbelb_233580 [Branchiostoma belcheri]
MSIYDVITMATAHAYFDRWKIYSSQCGIKLLTGDKTAGSSVNVPRGVCDLRGLRRMCPGARTARTSRTHGITLPVEIAPNPGEPPPRRLPKRPRKADICSGENAANGFTTSPVPTMDLSYPQKGTSTYERSTNRRYMTKRATRCATEESKRRTKDLVLECTVRRDAQSHGFQHSGRALLAAFSPLAPRDVITAVDPALSPTWLPYGNYYGNTGEHTEHTDTPKTKPPYLETDREKIQTIATPSLALHSAHVLGFIAGRLRHTISTSVIAVQARPGPYRAPGSSTGLCERQCSRKFAKLRSQAANSHYSMTKGAGFLGIGTDNVIKVKCDERGQMLPEELDKAIEDAKSQGSVPFFVNATSGTTVTGGYDPLGAIADVCQKHRLWLHVDAAWGGAVLTSRRHRGLMSGVDRADSLLWNPHKMLSLPLQCSIFVTREQGLLKAAHASGATYLFQKDKISYDASYDVGDKSIQCGRKTDPMKLWLSWKAHGTRGFEQHVDYVFELAQYVYDKLSGRNDFKMVLPGPNCTNVCFWYIPPSLQGVPEGPEFTQKLDQVAPVIKDRMTKKGNMMVQYQPLEGVPNFFRLVMANGETTRQDLDFLVEEIERLGADLVYFHINMAENADFSKLDSIASRKSGGENLYLRFYQAKMEQNPSAHRLSDPSLDQKEREARPNKMEPRPRRSHFAAQLATPV